MRTLVCEGIGGFYSSIGLTSLPWIRSLFLIKVFLGVFGGVLSL